MAVEPIRWKGDRLELLDQRLLPDQTVYVTCRAAAEVAQAIRDMVVRGAPAIGCAAAFGVVLSKGSPESYEILAKSRPTAVNLFWAVDRMRRVGQVYETHHSTSERWVSRTRPDLRRRPSYRSDRNSPEARSRSRSRVELAPVLWFTNQSVPPSP